MLPNRTTNPVQPQPVSILVAKIVVITLISFMVLIVLSIAGTYFYQQYSYNEQVKHSQTQPSITPAEDTIVSNLLVEDFSEKEIVGQ